MKNDCSFLFPHPQSLMSRAFVRYWDHYLTPRSSICAWMAIPSPKAACPLTCMSVYVQQMKST